MEVRRRISSVANGASVVPYAVLFSLPADVWVIIFSHLSHADYACLSATHRSILTLVDQIAWRDAFAGASSLLLVDQTASFYGKFQSYAPNSKSPIIRSRWWYACRHLSLVERCWSSVSLVATRCELPAPLEPSEQTNTNDTDRNRRRQLQRSHGRRLASNFARPILTIGRQWLVVALRSDLFLLPTETYGLNKDSQLGSRNSYAKLPDLSTASRISLNSDNIERTERPSPWQDVTCLKRIDNDAEKLLIGFADGNVQIVGIESKLPELHRPHARVHHHFTARNRQEIVDVAIHPLPVSLHTSFTTPHTNTQTRLVAALSKRGVLSLYLVDENGPSGRDEEKSLASELSSDGHKSRHWQIDEDGQLHDITHDDTGNDSPSTATDSGTETPRTYRSAAFNNAPRTNHTSGRSKRAWSLLLGGAPLSAIDNSDQEQPITWVAVGVTGQNAVQIYPLRLSKANTLSVGASFRVAASQHATSVYAMVVPDEASPLPSYLLFAGFYDGLVRVYDTRQLRYFDTDSETEDASTCNGGPNLLTSDLGANGHRTGVLDGTVEQSSRRSRRVRGDETELHAISIFYETLDRSPVYSLSLGGPRGSRLVVGGSRHSQIRVFDVSSLSGYDKPQISAPIALGGETPRGDKRHWSGFTEPSSDSPQYSIAADAYRVWGVTDRSLWCLNFGLAVPPHSAHTADSHTAHHKSRTSDPTIAYYRHDKYEISRSQTRLCTTNGMAE
ncbi:hypothetical protein BCV70DRAFT_121499 [Testicularia cyperi]|uniref:F-box domain-containing protein n=1 Tax=Testicularia cyperi TaxID=1882483 RepID=A0A317XMC8_9BASI|nr:hypothetical protein BCV70DRAFT_121499 [Testicularia cyperi]